MDGSTSLDLNLDYAIEGDDFEEEIDLNLSNDCSPLSLGDEQNFEDIVSDDDLFADEVAPGVDSVDVVDTEHVVAPAVGMTFASGDELIDHCHEYGKDMGFQIKIRSSERLKVDDVDEQISQLQHSDKYKRLRLTCSKGGKFESRSKNPGRGPKTSITGCPFKVNGSLYSDGVWKITRVLLEHNHPCIPERSKFLPNYRCISEQNRKRILENDRAGVPIAKNYNAFVVQYGGHDKVPFDERDCRNIISKSRRLHLKDGDFVAMRKYFDEMSSSNSNFFYMYDMSEDGRLRNVFWADGRSRAAYMEFGDVLSFDTTYVSNRYRMPFAPFVGVNHHGQSVLFGCALLCGEEIGNFVWLFRAWLKCMGGKAPQGIITDQCKSIGSAVAQVFTQTRHRWCIWHIMRNAKKHLSKNPNSEKILRALQNSLHDSLSVVEFEDSWKETIVSYGLERFNWCTEMYDQRTRWVPIYFKDDFWAGMSSTQRSEGINFFFKGFINVNTTLKQFVEQYGFALAKRVSQEEKATFTSLHAPTQCMTEHIFEHVYQKLYTSSKFDEFQQEVKDLTYTSASKVHDDPNSCVYDILVRRLKHGRSSRTTFKVTVEKNSMDIKCDCKNFQFRGILCSHVLCVFREEELDYVPERYILNRWRKDITRDYLKVSVPYYALLKKKPGELQRYEKMSNTFEVISSTAMTNESYFNQVMVILNDLVVKANDVSHESHGLRSHCLGNIGKVYGRRGAHHRENNCIEKGHAQDKDSTLVKDPIDRRGKGRPPEKRKGYYNDKRRGRRDPQQVSSNLPLQVQMYNSGFPTNPFSQHFMVNPPFSFNPPFPVNQSFQSYPFQHYMGNRSTQ